mmetsp:Transcript_20613/g.52290  ORF Transcript_20613/g.52290 Transcript_20613/m.52290 type:complete len:246 (-) Transcript_20613:1049-1786(-)
MTALTPHRWKASISGRPSGCAHVTVRPDHCAMVAATSSGPNVAAGRVACSRREDTCEPSGMTTDCRDSTVYRQPSSSNATWPCVMADRWSPASGLPPSDRTSASASAPGSTTALSSLCHCTTSRPSPPGAPCSARCTTPTCASRSLSSAPTSTWGRRPGCSVLTGSLLPASAAPASSASPAACRLGVDPGSELRAPGCCGCCCCVVVLGRCCGSCTCRWQLTGRNAGGSVSYSCACQCSRRQREE